MIDQVQSLLDEYTQWLRDRITLREINDCIEITTPYLDRNNDHLQIYAKRQNGGFLLTDDSYILHDLRISGCGLDSPKRQQLLRMILNGFGVRLDGDALTVQATPSSFALRKHSLIQAMLAVNDLFCMAQPIVASVFLEDVTAWLDLHEVRYSPQVKFTGKSGYDHQFDFLIPKSRQQPERLVRAINQPSRDTAEAIAFAWMDTREVRAPDSRLYAILNDGEHTPQPSVLDALRNYDVRPVLWSQRDVVVGELAN